MKKLSELTSSMKRNGSAPTGEVEMAVSHDGIKRGETGYSKQQKNTKLEVVPTRREIRAPNQISDELGSLWPSLLVDRHHPDNDWLMPYEADFELNDLNRFRIECQVALESSDDATVVQVIDLVWETLGCPTLSTAAYKSYIDALIDIPSDLLWQAARGVLKSYVYPSPPKPANFREQIHEELEEREIALRRINILIKNYKYISMMLSRT